MLDIYPMGVYNKDTHMGYIRKKDMEHCCCKKVKMRSDEEKKALTTRVNRIVGQMNGINKMIEEDRYCDDILIQLSAIDKSIKSLANVILESHMHTCLIDNIKEGNYEVVDEIVELFKRFQ